MIDIRPLTKHSEYYEAVHLQRLVWSWQEVDLIPVRFFVVAPEGDPLLGQVKAAKLLTFAADGHNDDFRANAVELAATVTPINKGAYVVSSPELAEGWGPDRAVFREWEAALKRLDSPRGAIEVLVGLDDRVADDAAHQVGGADRVVVAGDRVLHTRRVGVAVEHRDNRDIQLVRFFDRQLFLVGVDDEQDVGQPAHLLDPAQRALQLLAVARDVEHFLLRQPRRLAGQRPAASQYRFHPGDHHPRAERFGDVIIQRRSMRYHRFSNSGTDKTQIPKNEYGQTLA